MLGWEFPPTITGGLGTACAGLVKALDDLGTEVDFILPESKTFEPIVSHAVPVFPASPAPLPPPVYFPSPIDSPPPPAEPRFETRVYHHISFHTVPVQLSPYESETRVERFDWQTSELVQLDGGIPPAPPHAAHETTPAAPAAAPYDPAPAGSPPPVPETGLLADVKRYTAYVESLAGLKRFDVIHAHDWMTFPAALAIAHATGKPLVVHVHSTELDRSGDHGDTRIIDIERAGVHGATRVIAVSQFTKNLLVHHYGISPEKVDVVYNAVEPPADLRLAADEFAIKKGEKIVLFMGRLTSQKGPEYFLTAARKVLEVMDDVKFVMAGDGDMARQVVQLAAAFGIAHKVLFTGFLRGLDVERIFQLADLFVMPSVSEPFGIAPLEAVVRQVPTIISKQSGVSEVLRHALKVDFWDTNELANKIVAVLRHPTLAMMMREDAGRDVAKLTWPAAARQCLQTYGTAMGTL
ncbi:MAG: glycosyltransferase [Tepidisphaeraceae bacterium]